MNKVASFENIVQVSKLTSLFSHLLLRNDEIFLLKTCCLYKENESELNEDDLNKLRKNCETFITYNTKKDGFLKNTNTTNSELIDYLFK